MNDLEFAASSNRKITKGGKLGRGVAILSVVNIWLWKGSIFSLHPKNDIEKRHALKMKFLIFLFVPGFLADDDDQQCEHIGKFLFQIVVRDSNYNEFYSRS